MEETTTLAKGEQMEELLRIYFLGMGYFVVRGVQLQFQGNSVSDVDLLLYSRPSLLERHRINVDIKNKRNPQACERVIWANGLKEIFSFDACIVATTDNRTFLQEFGVLSKTTILDGDFLKKLKRSSIPTRVDEEGFLKLLTPHLDTSRTKAAGWRSIYETCKSRLLTEQDYSGLNSLLYELQYFMNEYVILIDGKNVALRMVYILTSYIMITLDYLMKDFSFVDAPIRQRRLTDGLRFGNVGVNGMKSIAKISAAISGKPLAQMIEMLEGSASTPISEFFSRNDFFKVCFPLALNFEKEAFAPVVRKPSELDHNYRVVLSVILDHFNIDRKDFYGTEAEEIRSKSGM